MDTVRIELGDGAWALVFKEMKHRTQRLLRDVFYRAVSMPAEQVLLSEIDTEDQMASELKVDLTTLKKTAMERQEVLLLNQVLEWSFGPVTKEVLDEEVSGNAFDILITEVDKLYGAPPLPGSRSPSKRSSPSTSRNGTGSLPAWKRLLSWWRPASARTS